MKYLIETLMFPPAVNIVIAVVGLALWNKRRRIALYVLAGDTLLLYLLSLPVSAWLLMSTLQSSPALGERELNNPTAQAIVVLGSGRNSNAPEYGGDTLSRLSLERLRYAARLQRQTHLPLMTVGNTAMMDERETPEAQLMKETAQRDFGVDVTWTEQRSHNTAENAANTAVLLRENGIHRIYLVTHAWHMPRAMWAFQHAGIEVIPAPTAFVTLPHGERERVWLPTARALYNTSLALHEMVGMLWYRVVL